MSHAPHPQPARDEVRRPGGGRRGWRFWLVPASFGLGFCVLQIGLATVRFGLKALVGAHGSGGRGIVALGLDLFAFFLAGMLAGLLVQRVVRGSRGGWRIALLCLTAIATPISVGLSLGGGLFGPLGVVVYGLIPYLLLVAVPALVRSGWLRLATRSMPE